MKFNPTMLQAYFIAGTQDVASKADFLPTVERIVQSGATAFQFRNKGAVKTAGRDEVVELARACHQITQKYQIPLFIDDDVDLASTVGAEGIHVGQKDERITSVLERVGDQMIVGLSCNTAAQITAANQLNGVDYLGTGTVYETNSKADAGNALGVDKLRELVQMSNFPVVAIGGITLERVAKTVATGAAGIAAISMFIQMTDPAQQIAEIKATVAQAGGAACSPKK
ncbi:thiamine phosphate synthase [Pediococcus acidilactici]|uniref:thiamine phosphate synthase n=1 Tax=Pediococcus acidilactici TaxID=1254 RepID=UPI00097F5432|nr:thiamine phosphate synthase [Pediococcus acidilactici]MCF4061677.1 thiamine phosphate synthase [Pediococcus acidilactici]QDJ22079.1 thiamine phosphate synthase [Pediococcus acidilactici]SJM43767.1 Thiamin-phosphate pyrophosphorylase [Pediococcus acidilactici]